MFSANFHKAFSITSIESSYKRFEFTLYDQILEQVQKQSEIALAKVNELTAIVASQNREVAT